MPAAAQPKPAPKTTPARAPARKRPNPAEKARIEQIFERFAAAEDAPRTEQQYQDPFTLVVAVALSAQATD
jgi:endonuclease-3